ncbi:MAG: hypothetical protein IJL89_09935, partial [Firmicutes bacterium]|nr:hypothetical protein [Bacillota bacterium]
MKRKLALILVAGCIAAGAFTGCSGKNNAPVADASQNTDLASQVTDENSVEDSGNAYTACLDAIQAVEDAKSAAVDSELIFSMTYEGETRTMTQHFNMKRAEEDEKSLLEYTLNAASKSEGGEDAEETSDETSGYFADGMLYQVIPQSSDVDSE